MNEKILRVENLSVSLGKEKIIQDLSFDVAKGEILTILGPNGAGKSTLLKALLGFFPHKGKIFWNKGLKINYLPERLSKEKFSIFPLTVADFFRIGEIPEKEAQDMLSSVGLKRKFWKRRSDNLSSGEFQRMLVAWVLSSKPDVVLFDEPMGGIDVGGKETIYSLISTFWKKRKLTIILVTHEIDIVYAYSSNVLCLNRKKLCYGSPREILTPENLRDVYGHDIKFYTHSQ